MASGLLHDEAAFRNRLEFIRRQQGSLHHLQALAGIVFAAAHRAGEHRAAAEGFGEGIRRFTVRGKAAADHILAVVHQDGCAFFAVVLFQLRQRLDDGYQRQAARASSTEKRQNIKGRHGTQLITKEDNTVFQFAAVLIRYREQLTGEILDHQARHKVLCLILLRKDEEDGGFLRREHFSVNGTVEAQDLLQLTVKKRIEPGQHRGHDGCHGLLRAVECGACQPACFVLGRQLVHKQLEAGASPRTTRRLQ